MFLEGVRILDLSTFLAAPTTGRLLAEWGAEVIKLEPPGGDTYRNFGPTMKMPITPDANPNFDMHNSGKHFVALNFRTEAGREYLHRLLETADVFLTNTRTKALQSMGLTYEDLKEKYPKLIYAHVLGYGEFGPRADTPGFDYTAFWARSGLMADIAPKEGAPVNAGVGMGDHTVSLGLVAAICAALYKRRETGRGEKIDSSLLQMATWLNMSSLNSAYYGREMPRTRREPNQPGNNVYKCRDGEWLWLAATDYKLYPRLVTDVMGHPELVTDPKYNTWENYLKNKDELTRVFDEIFLTKDREEWVTLLSEADISHEKVQHFRDVFADPQVKANNYVFEHTYPDGTKALFCPPPVHFGSLDYMHYDITPAREIGADNDKYMAELGYSPAEIARLREAGDIV